MSRLISQKPHGRKGTQIFLWRPDDSTKTYLNSLGLKFGLIVNFGKKQLQIYGVSPD
jgi:hypothetical protein